MGKNSQGVYERFNTGSICKTKCLEILPAKCMIDAGLGKFDSDKL